MDEQDPKTGKEKAEEGWEPETAPTAEGALKTEERSLDLGEHGQFAPGGYYNQLGVMELERLTIVDEDEPF